MADASVVHIGENSPEKVALILLKEIASVERKVFHSQPSGGTTTADRKWILDTFAECMLAVNDPVQRL
jgi:hypothetical protein